MIRCHRFGVFELRPAERRLLRDGQDVPIGGRGFDLLQALVECCDRVVTTDELYERVWPGLAVEPNNLQVQVWALRKLLGRDVISTVARRGYRFVPRVQVVDDGLPSDSLPMGPGHGPRPWPQAHRPVKAPPHDAWQASVAEAWRTHRLVTLTGTDPRLLRRQAHHVSAPWRHRLQGGVWQFEASALLPAPMPHRSAGPAVESDGADDPLGDDAAELPLPRLLQRLAQREALLVVVDGHRADPSLRDALDLALALAPLLRILVTAPEALGLQDEQVVALAMAASVPTAPTATRPLRWRARVRLPSGH